MYESSPSPCNIIQATSNTQCRSRRPPQSSRPFKCLPVPGCWRLLQPHHQPPLADGCPLASRLTTPPRKKKKRKFKQGSEGKRRRKKAQARFRAVRISGSAGCRRNQLMPLSRPPPVDHLPGSRVAVVAVSAGLAPRRAGPRGREGAICPAPGCSAACRGGQPGASPLPRAAGTQPRVAEPSQGAVAKTGSCAPLFCRVFARSPLPLHKPTVSLEHLCACVCFIRVCLMCRQGD